MVRRLILFHVEGRLTHAHTIKTSKSNQLPKKVRSTATKHRTDLEPHSQGLSRHTSALRDDKTSYQQASMGERGKRERGGGRGRGQS